MFNNESIQKLGLEIINKGTLKDIKGCYIGDLLSFVMGRASEGDVWITVMNNINIVAVAVMADISAIILCEDVNPMEDVIEKAKEKDITIYKSSKTAFELAKEIEKLL